ncbi:MAG: LD-carboxypeptidase [Vicingaceae bacterium]
MIRPPNLKKGDRVALLSTARKIDAAILNDATEVFGKWGLEIVPAPKLFAAQDQFAGSDDERIENLQWALDDPSVKAILCARGGYGTARIIDHLNWKVFLDLPKWIIGYSDVCVLHGHLQNMGVESLHASMPVNFDNNSPESLQGIQDALFGSTIGYQFAPDSFNTPGSASGPVVGGNLSIMYSLVGSSSMPPLKGSILFLEDLDEYLYHIDRMIVALKRAGVFETISALVVGGMTDMNDNEIPFGKNPVEIIADQLEEYSFPISFGMPAGHLSDNLPLIFGRPAHLEVNEQGSSLKFSS